MDNAILTTRDLAIGYKTSRSETRTIASSINVALHRGELVCLLGPNGAGKSTLMRTLCAMQPALSGVVELDGVDIHQVAPRERARRLAVVLTERVTVGLLDVYTLVSLGRHPHTDWTGRLSDKDHQVVRWALEVTGAVEFSTRPVGDLSDGERQRVMMARALAQEPSVMVLDEITAFFLDLPRRVDIMRLLSDLARRTGRAILLSTHDLDLALRTADQVWLLPKDGQLHAGMPEKLVLNGALGEAFASEGVHFDLVSGSFQIHRPHGGHAAVVGNGVAGLWTRRALDRLGYTEVEQAPAAATVEVTAANGRTEWRVRDGQISHTLGSLDEVVSYFRRTAGSDRP